MMSDGRAARRPGGSPRDLVAQRHGRRADHLFGDCSACLGHHFTRPKMRALCKVLGVVDDEAAERGEPELAVLVVRQSDGLAGAGLVGRRRAEARLHRPVGRAARRSG